ncbi:5'/3'-nucleotidase SurE [Sphingosinicellaceae bacterium]|nr:5'/3'-nucleotidase SurE [Sphingosinicellaceae bacterium]
MRILVTNDDGIHAPGLVALEKIAAQLSDDVWVVAPAEEQSGAGHSLTLSEPIRLREMSDRRFAVRGTPTDCVMLALGHVMRDHRPDLILSGVNRGGNLGEDVTYSGTVSAAMEGCLAGIRSVAMSQVMADYNHGMERFDAAEQHGAGIVQTLLDAPWPDRMLVNINFPPEVTGGVEVTEQGFRDYGHIALDARVDPRGFPYFWFGYGREIAEPGHQTDLKAIRHGRISVTPLHLDLTYRESLKTMRSLFGERDAPEAAAA